MYSKEIANAYIALNVTDVTITAMVDELEDVIVDGYDGTPFKVYKANWTKEILDYFRDISIPIVKSPKPNWDKVSNKLVDRLYACKVEKNKMARRPPASKSTTCTSASSCSTTSKSVSTSQTTPSASVSASNGSDCLVGDVTKLNEMDKATIIGRYDSLDKNRMWKLSTGTLVEDQMRQRALKQTYEDLSHSLIFDVNDPEWLHYFTLQELAEIRHLHPVALPAVPDETQQYLNQLKGLSVQELYNKISTKQLPLTCDSKWIQDSFIQAFRLLQSGYLPINKEKTTEGGLLKRMWTCLDMCFDFSCITCISGEICSKSSADAMNSTRSSILCRQKSGRKMDFIFDFKDYELGCGECGLISGDMLIKLVSESPALKRDLVITGFYIGEKKLKLVVLDCPAGYVTRYDAMEDVSYPQDEDELYRKLSAVLRMILAGRILMEDTAHKLIHDDTEIPIGRRQEEYMVPCFLHSVSNKKRKQKESM